MTSTCPWRKTEGIPNLGGAKLEIVFADTKGDPKNGMSEAERLVTQEKVVAMIGAYQSSVTKTASQATERLKIPYVCSDSSSPTLTERDFKYFFRVSPHDDIFAKDQFNFLKDLEKKKGKKINTVALLYENTEFGSNVGKQIRGKVCQGIRLQGRRQRDLCRQRNRRDERSRHDHQEQARRRDARLLHHRRHSLHQDVQGNGLRPQGLPDHGRLHRARATCPPSRRTGTSSSSAPPSPWTSPRRNRSSARSTRSSRRSTAWT